MSNLLSGVFRWVLGMFCWMATAAPLSGEYYLHGLHKPNFLTADMPLERLFRLLLTHYGGPATPAIAPILEKTFFFSVACVIEPMSVPISILWSSWDQIFFVSEAGRRLEYMQLFILSIAAVLIWRTRHPSPLRTTALALCIGASLIYRSTLAFLGPILALADWMQGKQSWRNALILCVLPYLFLLPWIRLNYAAERRFIPFENTGPHANLAAGIVGFVYSYEGDWRALVDSPEQWERDFYGTALREACWRPVRTLSGIFSRMWAIVEYRPYLFLFACLGWWLNRRSEDMQRLALLCAYLFGTHCLMAVKEDYFHSLWPLLVLLGSSIVRPLGRAAAAFRLHRLARYAGGLVAGGLAGALILVSVYTLTLVHALVPIVNDPASLASTLARELRRFPDEPWLLSEQGRNRMLRGDLPGAIDSFARAARADPGAAYYALMRDVALMIRGNSGPLLRRSERPAKYELCVISAYTRAYAYYRSGSLSQALQEFRDPCRENILVYGPAAPEVLRRLDGYAHRNASSQNAEEILTWSPQWLPLEERRRFDAFVKTVCLRDARS